MDQTLDIDQHQSVNVWTHDGRVHLALDEHRYGRVQIAMTPEHAWALAKMLENASQLLQDQLTDVK